MTIQRTFVILKPDAVQRGLVGEILSRFERKGLLLTGLSFLRATQEQATAHYLEHREKPFFAGLVAFITSSPLVALTLDGDEAIAVVRTLVGTTDGRKAPPGTIRGDFGLSRSSNLVHASDSPESAERELAIWFPTGSLAWESALATWVRGD